MDSPTLDSDQCMCNVCFIFILFVCVFNLFYFFVMHIVEMCHLTKDDNNKVVYHQLTPKELNDKIKEYEEAHKDDKKEDD